METVEKDYILEKKFAAREFEEKKIDLKESLILELEEKKRLVDGERTTMELTGGTGNIFPNLPYLFGYFKTSAPRYVTTVMALMIIRFILVLT